MTRGGDEVRQNWQYSMRTLLYATIIFAAYFAGYRNAVVRQTPIRTGAEGMGAAPMQSPSRHLPLPKSGGKPQPP